jgi:hypothetical protein
MLEDSTSTQDHNTKKEAKEREEKDTGRRRGRRSIRKCMQKSNAISMYIATYDSMKIDAKFLEVELYTHTDG